MSQTDSLPSRDSHLVGESTYHKIIVVECDTWIFSKSVHLPQGEQEGHSGGRGI